MKKTNKALAIVLSLLMLFGMMSTAAFADPVFTELPTSPSGLEAGDWWFDLEGMITGESMDEGNANVARQMRYLFSDDLQQVQIVTREDSITLTHEQSATYLNYLRQVEAVSDDPVFTELPLYSYDAESGEYWFDRDAYNEMGYDAHSYNYYLSEDHITLKLESKNETDEQGNPVVTLYTAEENPDLFSCLKVVPAFGEPLPYSDEGLADGDYWYDYDGLMEWLQAYRDSVPEEYTEEIDLYIAAMPDAAFRMAADNSFLRVTIPYSYYDEEAGEQVEGTETDDGSATNGSPFWHYLRQVGVDPYEGFTKLPNADSEDFADGTPYFDMDEFITCAWISGNEYESYYRMFEFYLSEDGTTLRCYMMGDEDDLVNDNPESAFFFYFVRRHGEDPNAGFNRLPIADSDDLAYGAYWFNMEQALADQNTSEEDAAKYRNVPIYLSEDGTTLRGVLPFQLLEVNKDSEEGTFYFNYLRRHGVDPLTEGFVALPTADSDALADGDHWFDVVGYLIWYGLDPDNEEEAATLQSAEFYLSEDATVFRMIAEVEGERINEDIALDSESWSYIAPFLNTHGTVYDTDGFDAISIGKGDVGSRSWYFDFDSCFGEIGVIYTRCNFFYNEALDTIRVYANDTVLDLTSEDSFYHDFKPFLYRVELKNAAEPTCTVDGYTGDYVIEKNGEPVVLKAGEAITAPGHVFDDTIAENVTVVPATCHSTGLKSVKCKNCDETKDTVLSIDAKNHDGETETRGAAPVSCTENGYTGDVYCLSCNQPISTGETINAPGHRWSDWTVTKDATETEDGEKTRTCTVCSETDKVVIPATGATPAESLCKWCGQTHNGFFGKIVGLFHSILYFFAHLFGKR